MKKAVCFASVLFIAVSAGLFAQDSGEEPAAFEFVLGPRIGVGYVFADWGEFSNEVSKFMYGDTSRTFYPVMSAFGLSLEQRILLGDTRNHFAFQEILMVNGLEQGTALPILSLLIGYRDARGFEFGAGPMVSISGVQILIAMGWTFSFSGVYVPVDVSYSIPNSASSSSVSITTGFNFITNRRRNR